MSKRLMDSLVPRVREVIIFVLGMMVALLLPYFTTDKYSITNNIDFQIDPIQSILAILVIYYATGIVDRKIGNERSEKDLCLSWLREIDTDAKKFRDGITSEIDFVEIVNMIKILRTRSFDVTEKIKTEYGYDKNFGKNLVDAWKDINSLITETKDGLHGKQVKISKGRIDVSNIRFEIDSSVTRISIMVFDLMRDLTNKEILN